jgi:hypothetical protein
MPLGSLARQDIEFVVARAPSALGKLDVGTRADASSNTLLDLLQQTAHLIDVINVVSSHMAGKLLHCHPAAFGVHAVPLPLLGREPGQHPQVGLSQQAKHLQSVLGNSMNHNRQGGPIRPDQNPAELRHCARASGGNANW